MARIDPFHRLPTRPTSTIAPAPAAPAPLPSVPDEPGDPPAPASVLVMDTDFHRLERQTIPFESIAVVTEHLVRPLNEAFARQLSGSIARLGLLHPLLIDRRGELVAGHHRYNAIKLLIEQDPQRAAAHFPNQLIPVHQLAFAYAENPELAKAYAGAENRHRRQFTAQEIKSLVQVLRTDPAIVQRRGRLAEGERSLVNELVFSLRVSPSHAKKLLKDAGETRNEATRQATPLDLATTQVRRALVCLDQAERLLAADPIAAESGRKEVVEQAIAALRNAFDVAHTAAGEEPQALVGSSAS